MQDAVLSLPDETVASTAGPAARQAASESFAQGYGAGRERHSLRHRMIQGRKVLMRTIALLGRPEPSGPGRHLPGQD